METRNDPEIGIRYLSLGVFARQVIDTLVEYLETGTVNLEYLGQAIDSLKKIQSEEALPRGAKAVQYYEQVRTFYDISTPEERDRMIKTLQALRSMRATRADLKDKAKQAIEFFFKLEKQALINFERPPARSMPTGIRKLWQAL